MAGSSADDEALRWLDTQHGDSGHPQDDRLVPNAESRGRDERDDWNDLVQGGNSGPVDLPAPPEDFFPTEGLLEEAESRRRRIARGEAGLSPASSTREIVSTSSSTSVTSSRSVSRASSPGAGTEDASGTGTAGAGPLQRSQRKDFTGGRPKQVVEVTEDQIDESRVTGGRRESDVPA